MFQEISLNVLQKQYGYTNFSDLILKRSAVWDKYMGNISETFVREILDYNTCIPEALDYFWGKILKITRNFSAADGSVFSLTDDQFREIIKIRAFGTTWKGDILSMNVFLKNLFKDRGNAYILDNLDMTVQIFVFDFILEDWESYLFTTQDILPRPGGVGTKIYQLDTENTFGFYGSDFQPFNQGVFWNGIL
jgi:hypothetical protein